MSVLFRQRIKRIDFEYFIRMLQKFQTQIQCQIAFSTSSRRLYKINTVFFCNLQIFFCFQKELISEDIDLLFTIPFLSRITFFSILPNRFHQMRTLINLPEFGSVSLSKTIHLKSTVKFCRRIVVTDYQNRIFQTDKKIVYNIVFCSPKRFSAHKVLIYTFRYRDLVKITQLGKSRNRFFFPLSQQFLCFQLKVFQICFHRFEIAVMFCDYIRQFPSKCNQRFLLLFFHFIETIFNFI